jgi:dipeptidyl-peptidase-4
MVDVRSSTRSWPEVLVRNGDGHVLHTIPSSAEAPTGPMNLELVTLDDARGMRACVIRPRGFVSGRRYPVIVHVYGGPHALMVKADQRAYAFDQALADAGTIVVAIDGRGTPRRDRAWERAIKGRLAEVPLEDQVDGLRALGRRFPELDLDRVGIYGWSFGGTMAALAVMCRPDIFHVAVAGAPVTDWRDYDTHYTERYLDLPDVDAVAYVRSSPLHQASGLGRPLLLVHGTADDNVYFFHSLKLADALLRAGRSFDFLPLPGVTHQIGDTVLRAEVWSRISHFLLSHFRA